jgi:hypothetical protein
VSVEEEITKAAKEAHAKWGGNGHFMPKNLAKEGVYRCSNPRCAARRV